MVFTAEAPRNLWDSGLIAVQVTSIEVLKDHTLQGARDADLIPYKNMCEKMSARTFGRQLAVGFKTGSKIAWNKSVDLK